MPDLQPLLLPWLVWTACIHLLLAGLRRLDGGPPRRRSTLMWAAVIAALIIAAAEFGGRLVGA